MFFEKNADGFIVRVRLTPNSSCCKVMGIFCDASGVDFLKINVIAPPEKGKANAELIKFLSKTLKIAKSDFTILSGELDRYKKIYITSPKDITEELVSLG